MAITTNCFRKSILANYTTERFYLLSELEQLCETMVFLDEDSNPKAANDPFVLNIIYVLWKFDLNPTVVISILDKIKSCGQFSDFSKSVVVIEVLIKSNELWEERVSLMMENIVKIYECGCLVCAISDSVVGPGLEVALDCVNYVNNSIPTYPSRIICNQRDDMIGHDALIEPDGISNVFQAIIYNHDHNDWMAQHFPSTRTKPIDTGDGNHSDKSFHGRYYGVISLLFIIISILMYVKSNCY